MAETKKREDMNAEEHRAVVRIDLAHHTTGALAVAITTVNTFVREGMLGSVALLHSLQLSLELAKAVQEELDKNEGRIIPKCGGQRCWVDVSGETIHSSKSYDTCTRAKSCHECQEGHHDSCGGPESGCGCAGENHTRS